MWCWVLTLIVFGNLQDGIRCNPLSVADNGYVATLGIGCHKIHSLAEKWDQARSICKTEGGDLAVINSKTESEVIRQLLSSSLPHVGSIDQDYALIGFDDRSVEGQYVTIESETLVEAGFNEWAANEPNDAGIIENCGSIFKNGLLNDISCDQRFAFVCEQPQYDQSICGNIVRVNVTVDNEIIAEGGEVSMACDVAGYPVPKVSWYRNDDLIRTNDRIKISSVNGLIISETNKNDAGKYRCKAANKYMSDAHTVDIKVIVPVKVKIAINPGLFLTGSEISIACNADGYPTPTIQWYKDDNLIQNNARTNIADELIISNAEKNDAGKYRCEAANEYTSSAETVDVRVAGTSKSLPDAIGGYASTLGIGCHKIHSLAEKWAGARSICKEEGGDLAVINSKTESEVIRQLLSSSLPHVGSIDQDYALIGFDDRSVEGQYVTIESETLVEAGFNEWAADEPSNGGGIENCGSIFKNGLLNDISCDQRSAFVCERPQYDQSICGNIVRVNVTVVNEIIAEGGEVSMACDVAGYPVPKVSWYKNDDLIRTNDRIKISAVNGLIISETNKNDAGKYRCKAANKYMSDAHTVDIKVTVPVKVKIAMNPGLFLTGSEISITCNADGYPSPTIQWYKDDNLIQNTARINIAANKLIISTAEKKDAGKYRCEAANEYTSSAETVDVRVAETSKSLPGAIGGYASTFGIGCHKIHSLAEKWDGARSICKEEGGDLAVINSKTESEVIRQLLSSSLPHVGSIDQDYALIGFDDRSVEGRYVTIESETLVEAGFNEWAANEPNNAAVIENCGSIFKNGLLNDISCDQRFAFVCEQPQYDQSICGNIVRVNVTVDNEIIAEGGEVSMACDVAGYPVPKVSWYKNDDLIRTNDRIKISSVNGLIISETNKNDAGKYRCKAANKYMSDAHTVDIKVTVPVKVKIAINPGLFLTGSEISIACNADGYPTPTIQWYKDDNLIQNNARINIADELIISNAEKNDAGKYRCEAANEYTSSAETVHVRVVEPSESVPNATREYKYTAGIGYHKIHSLAETSNTARSICQKEGGDLAIIDSDQESQVIVELVALSLPHTASYDSNYALVGFHGRIDDVQYPDIQVENSGHAVSDEQGLNIPPRAKRDVEDCHSVDKDGRLHGISCNQPYAFVCERREYEEEICEKAVGMNVTVAKELTIEGAEISIACHVIGYPASGVLWYKDDNLIQSNDRINIWGANELIIPNANKNDTGKYRCEAAGDHLIGAHTVDIKVIVPVKVEIAVNKGLFTERSEISIVCNADGYPTPTVQWYKDDNRIQKTERIDIAANKLIISNAEKNDAGKYRCEATNEYTSSAETVDIKVAFPTTANIIIEEGPFYRGSEINVACTVDGYPTPMVIWYKGGNSIQTDNRIAISASNTLIISNATKDDTGTYRCVAANEISRYEDTVDIKVAGIYIHPNCHDASFFEKCDLIVKGNFCKHKYYAKFCCRSCTEAGQLPAR